MSSQRLLRIGAMLCAVSTFGGAPSRCFAQQPLRLDRIGCASPWADGIERFVAIELGTAPEDRPEGALEISVRCQADEVELEASERGTASTHRRMDLSGTAESVRSRIVALAIAGLVRELAVIGRSAAQSAADRAPEPTAPPPVSVPPPPGSTSDAERALQLDVFFAGSTFSAGQGVLLGGGLRARVLLLAPLYFALDGQLGTYARDSELGSARLVAGSGGARVGWSSSWSSSALGAGVGQRLGVARASASADQSGTTAGSVVGLWAAPFAFVMADTALSRHVRVGIDAELGVVLSPVRGRIEDSADIAAAGAWIALCATLGLQL